MMKDISVIIPIYNEQQAIRRCLESLHIQTILSKEIIIVDDGSTDKTAIVLSELKIKSEKLKIFRQTHKGPGAARNLGMAKAAGNILVFVDADMRFHPKFLDELTKPIRAGTSKGTFARNEFVSNWTNRWARMWNYRNGIFEPRRIPVDYPKTAPVFRAILKSEFDRVGGFDESRGYDDDWSLSEQLGYQAIETLAQYYHDNPATLREVFSQARWAAKRRGKFGVLGVLGRLGKAIPIWATPLFVAGLVAHGGRLADSMKERVFGGFLFSLVAQTGEVLGVLEYLAGEKRGK